MSDHPPPQRVIPIQPLFKSEPKVYPRSIQGFFQRWRWGFVALTQLIFYGLCWLPWNGRQAVLFDLEAEIEKNRAERDAKYLEMGVISEGVIAADLKEAGTYKNLTDEDVELAYELAEKVDDEDPPDPENPDDKEPDEKPDPDEDDPAEQK